MPVTEEESDDPLQISGDLVIGPLAVEIDASDKINHSCDPNLGIVGQTFFVTLREIQAGEEVCFDYAMCLSPAPGVLPYQMECHCGSSRCRGIITDTDWTNPKLRANYQGSNSWYLEEKIKLLEKHE